MCHTARYGTTPATTSRPTQTARPLAPAVHVRTCTVAHVKVNSALFRGEHRAVDSERFES